ncbi:bifunctional adenosylcobinamide kinase/adenosylcobinamide-phosphate guanylyltransferase [Kyrpidia spormannii]|uniref:Uncharacterized protein n=1 Tax=Kyrpidia spormannii TaxID=2055160 RepID=A0ACA8Z6K8_9BACL|nr:bifunctional adenosylcobinamide kinase/adenosylcobinamide-phosphate guanylyltransferase [Kyrpidia spormannii]CAB3390383.1 conserved protein of unknown function [Kyrpidia spormannii]
MGGRGAVSEMDREIRRVTELGLTLRWGEGCWWLESEEAWESLSSAVYGGGRQSGIRAVANVTVDLGYKGLDPAGDIARRLKSVRVPTPAVGMMTAVDVRETQWSVVNGPGGRWLIALTAGTSNALCAGEKPGWFDAGPGTINMTAVFDGALSEQAAVNAVITLTEVKSRVLRERGVRCAESGLPATGTSTDAVAVLFRKGGRSAAYAGPGSEAGWMLAQEAHRLLHRALRERDDRRGGLPSLTFVIGGARSGKSEWAEGLADRWARQLGVEVVYVATARKEGMEERVRRHQRRRPPGWKTIEAPEGDVLAGLWDGPGPGGVVLIDSLTHWVTAWMSRRLALRSPSLDGSHREPVPEWSPEEERDLKETMEALIRRCRRSPYPVVVVSDEVGEGVVPATAVGCLFRDALGLANQTLARASGRVYRMTAGLPVEIRSRAIDSRVEAGLGGGAP